ncbi:SAM-dependent methyltransferase [Amycolatopsis tolypomycina]|uniref:SAM-dependent methyltransferase n=1 Tax=Amycolatopsis tolypomycina TaxID=208445 RepID=UPI0033AE69F4
MTALLSPTTTGRHTTSLPGKECNPMALPPESDGSAPEREGRLTHAGSTSFAAYPSISDTALKVAADQWKPPPLDLVNASPARIRDFFLGGDQSFAVDRDWCANASRLVACMLWVYRDERDFLHRAIRYAKRNRGIHRFLVIGAGLPFARPVHEDVLSHRRGVVVYAEPEEYVAAHLDLFAADLPQVSAVRGDFLEPGTILFSAGVRALLRDDDPVCVVLTGVLETIADTDDATVALRCYTERLPAGSLVIATHATVDGLDTGDAADSALAERRRLLCRTYGRTAYRPPRYLRTAGQLRDILAGLKLVQPGITHTSDWRNPQPAGGARPAESLCLAAVATVPSRRI